MKSSVRTMVAVIVAVSLGIVAVRAYVQKNRPTLSSAPDNGVSFLIEADYSKVTGGTNAAGGLKDALLKRLSARGLKIFWDPISETQFRIVSPATGTAADELAADHFIFQTGNLEFRLVHENSYRLLNRYQIPDGYEVFEKHTLMHDGRKKADSYLVSQKTELALRNGTVKSATVTRDQLGQPQISFTLKPDAAAAFASITRSNVGRELAIILDGTLVNAPRLQTPIESGQAVIAGGFSETEAAEVAKALEDPLPVPIKLLEVKIF